MLPSISTPNIQISYEIVASVSHEGMFSASQDLPSVIFPIYVTVDPQGPFDMGREYAVVREQNQVDQATRMSEEERQMEQAIRLS